jgi:hypothetical protein
MTAAVEEKPSVDVNTTQVEDTENKKVDGHTIQTYSPEQIQHRFDTLRGLSQGEMAALNKKVRRTIDWRLMPCITLMFLMKYVGH